MFKQCNNDDVKRAYRIYSQSFHPDRHINDNMNLV